MSTGLQGLLTIVAIVAVSPFVARLFGGRLPTVALLMLVGIAVGPSGLAWLQQDPAIDLFFEDRSWFNLRLNRTEY